MTQLCFFYHLQLKFDILRYSFEVSVTFPGVIYVHCYYVQIESDSVQCSNIHVFGVFFGEWSHATVMDININDQAGFNIHTLDFHGYALVNLYSFLTRRSYHEQ